MYDICFGQPGLGDGVARAKVTYFRVNVGDGNYC